MIVVSLVREVARADGALTTVQGNDLPCRRNVDGIERSYSVLIGMVPSKAKA